MTRQCARCRRVLHTAERFTRCDVCLAELAVYRAAWRAKRDEAKCYDCDAPRLADNVRCEPCRDEHRAYCREQSAARRAEQRRRAA